MVLFNSEYLTNGRGENEEDLSIYLILGLFYSQQINAQMNFIKAKK